MWDFSFGVWEVLTEPLEARVAVGILALDSLLIDCIERLRWDYDLDQPWYKYVFLHLRQILHNLDFSICLSGKIRWLKRKLEYFNCVLLSIFLVLCPVHIAVTPLANQLLHLVAIYVFYFAQEIAFPGRWLALDWPLWLSTFQVKIGFKHFYLYTKLIII